MTRSDWQELAFSLAIEALMAIAMLTLMILLPKEITFNDATGFLVEPADTPLMTMQEKAWAKESGVGSYSFDGKYFIDENLPSTYWEE